MISLFVKHMESSGKFLVSRVLGQTSGKIKPVLNHFDISIAYNIDEQNGSTPTTISTLYPSDVYSQLNYIPVWTHHRFIGWYTTPATPTASGDTSGYLVDPTQKIMWGVSTIYARWQLPTAINFDATTNGGSMPSGWTSPDYYLGQQYGTLPTPTKSGEVFIGWYTSGGTRVTETSTVAAGTLTARYLAVTYTTRFEVYCYSSYLTAGIYSANTRNSSNPTVVSWGDGKIDVVYGNISQLTHKYATTGTYEVGISDNISTFALSYSNSTWYQTTTNNRYVIRKILDVSSNVTSLPSYAFYYMYYLWSVNLGSAGSLSLGNYCFYYCAMGGTAATYDFSGRTITTLPSSCFYYNYYLKTFKWPKGLTTISGSAFRYCFYYSASTTTLQIPEGVTTISGTYAFAYCYYLTAITLPSTLTNLNNYTFHYCQRLATITANRSTAPTVQSATFGSSTSYYTGRASYSAGTNRLYVPSSNSGYDSSYWGSVLLDSTKCGFKKEVKS